MLDLLKLNPEYVSWGPYEDYMWKESREEGGPGGWDSRVIVGTWSDNPFILDELNEVVNFYFEINRKNRECETCGGNGYHPDSHWVAESFYRHSSPFNIPSRRDQIIHQGLQEKFGLQFHTKVMSGAYPSEELLAKYGDEFKAFCFQMRETDGSWHDKVTQDEVDALVKEERLWNLSDAKWNAETKQCEGGRKITAEEVNTAERGKGVVHDGINRCILVQRRLERFGMPYTCNDCGGCGNIYDEPDCHLGLVLWVLHPRKGCSRGVHIKHIDQDQLPEVFAFLKEAAERNVTRFEKVIEAYCE